MLEWAGFSGSSARSRGPGLRPMPLDPRLSTIFELSNVGQSDMEPVVEACRILVDLAPQYAQL